MTVTVHHGDSRVVLTSLPDNSVDSCCTDPPYALVSIGKRFGTENAAPAKSGKSGVYARSAAGFMGQRWDNGETAFDPDFWREVYRVLKPGAHVLAFGGTRTFGSLQVAIGEAGFEIRDSILDLVDSDGAVEAFLNSLDEEQVRAFVRCYDDATWGGLLAWIFGSGFPKSHSVSKGIDKAAGAEREVIAEGAPVKRMIPGADQHKDGWEKNNGRVYVPTETAAATDEARQWEGWGTALKPAFEPIVVARKPLIGTVVANVLRHGTGALNIDGCRVGDFVNTTPPGTDRYNAANFEQGYRPNAYGRDGEASADRRYQDRGATNFAPTPGPRGGDVKGRWPANVIVGSQGAAEAFPAAPGQQRPVTGEERSHRTLNAYGDFGASRTGAEPRGDSGSAARFFYSAKADADDRCGSKHPTVKPVDLMAYLCRLVTPPGGVVLDPFAGSGSTGMACLREGFDCILIEREAQYVADINRRLAHVEGADTPLFANAPKAEDPPLLSALQLDTGDAKALKRGAA